MDTEKERWIDGAMRSLEGAERARPSADLWERIELRIPEAETASPPRRMNWWALAAGIALLATNAFALTQWYGRSSNLAQARSTDSAPTLNSDFTLYE